MDHISVKLPPAQPMASIDAEVAKRCFIVCGPPVPPIYAMKDAFCRFGNLIDVYMLPGKNCGYAKYASVDSANEAIEVRSSLFFLQPLLLYLLRRILYPHALQKYLKLKIWYLLGFARARNLWFSIEGARGGGTERRRGSAKTITDG